MKCALVSQDLPQMLDLRPWHCDVARWCTQEFGTCAEIEGINRKYESLGIVKMHMQPLGILHTCGV